jgi:hypothetical protein
MFPPVPLLLDEGVTLPEASSWSDLEDKNVRETSFVPAEKLTAAAALDEAETVVLVRVFAEE